MIAELQSWDGDKWNTHTEIVSLTPLVVRVKGVELDEDNIKLWSEGAGPQVTSIGRVYFLDNPTAWLEARNKMPYSRARVLIH